MTKLNSFVSQFVAIVKGDDAQVQGSKAWRSAESALKVQIASLSGDLIRKEDVVEQASENLSKARVNNGVQISDRDQYISNLISAKERLVQAEKQLEAHQKTIAFLEEEYANLKAE
jgi:hypothetical protein